MRILHLMPSIESEYGGPPIIASRLAAAQSGLGHEVGLASYEVRPELTEIAPIPEGTEGTGPVKRHLIPVPTGLDKITGTASAKRLGPVIGEYDVLHIHCTWEPILRACGAEAKRRGVPYTIVLHGMLDPWSLSQSTFKKKLAMSLGWRTFFNNAAFFHTGNRDEVRLIKPLGLTPPCEIIPNGVFFDEYDPMPPKDVFRAAHPELGDAPFMLFLSRIHYKKGLDYLAKSFALFAKENSDAHLVVAGPEGGAGPQFVADIEAAGLTDRVHMVGPLYEDDKLSAISDADCFVLPSRQEGFSIAITEMLACGKPCIVTEGCHYPEVGEVNAGEVLPLEERAIADAMVRVMGDADLRAEMSRNGIELIRSRFTWTKVAERTLEAYANSLPKRG